MAQRLYSYGLPFSQWIANNIDDYIEEVFKLKKATLIVIDGGQGEGKTTLAVHIADYINSKRNLPPIDLEFDNHPQLSMGGDDFLLKLAECHKLKLPTIIYDEAQDYSAKNALSGFNKGMSNIFKMFRQYQIIPILCTPAFDDIDRTIFKTGAFKALLHLHNRDLTQGNIKLYGLKRTAHLRKRSKEVAFLQQVYEENSPNIRGHFLDLEQARGEKLAAISMKGKERLHTKQIINQQGLLDMEAIMNITGKSISLIQKRIKKNGIKKAATINRRAYYHKSILEQI